MDVYIFEYIFELCIVMSVLRAPSTCPCGAAGGEAPLIPSLLAEQQEHPQISAEHGNCSLWHDVYHFKPGVQQLLVNRPCHYLAS